MMATIISSCKDDIEIQVSDDDTEGKTVEKYSYEDLKVIRLPNSESDLMKCIVAGADCITTDNSDDLTNIIKTYFPD